jgi:hypothetical protein
MTMLILHVGGPKTGSSAIQRSLALSSDSLKKYNILYKNYPITDSNEIFNGNGDLLYKAILNNDETEICNELLKVIDIHSTSICSNEDFIYLNLSQWSFFIKICTNLKIKLTVFFFLRDVIPYIISSYSEKVKHGLNLSFEESIESNYVRYDHGDCLKILHNFSNHLNLKVVHYEENFTDIIKEFEDLLILPKGTLIKFNGNINRSLNSYEISLVLKFNNFLLHFSGLNFNEPLLLSLSLSRYLMQFPSSNNHFYLSDSLFLKILQLYSPIINWIKDNYSHLLNFNSLHHTTNSTFIDLSDTDKLSIMNRAFDWFFGFEVQNSSIFYSLLQSEAVTNIYKILSNFKRPSDFNDDKFDILAYLILNPDLIKTSVDPYLHYINHGKFENRRCSL